MARLLLLAALSLLCGCHMAPGQQNTFESKETAGALADFVADLRSSVQSDLATWGSRLEGLRSRYVDRAAETRASMSSVSPQGALSTGWELILDAGGAIKRVLDAKALSVRDFLSDVLGHKWSAFASPSWLRDALSWDNLADFEITSNLQDVLSIDAIRNYQRPETIGQLYSQLENVVDSYCDLPDVTHPAKVPTTCTGPQIRIAYVPKSCALEAATKKIVCDPAKLVLHKTPGQCTLKHLTPFIWTGKQCHHKETAKEKVVDPVTEHLLPDAVAVVRTFEIPGQRFQRKVMWLGDDTARLQGILKYKVTCTTTSPADPEATRTVYVGKAALEAVIGSDATGANRPLLYGGMYTCSVAEINIKGSGPTKTALPFITDPAPPPAPLTYAVAPSSWMVSGWTPSTGARSYKLQCAPVNAGNPTGACNSAGAITGVALFTGPPTAGSFVTLPLLPPNTAMKCYLVAYSDVQGTVPSTGICSAPVTMTSLALPFPAAETFTLGNLGTNNGQNGQNGWYIANEAVSGTPVVPGQVVTNTAAYKGSNSWRIGGCSTRCTTVNFMMKPGYPANDPSQAVNGWPSTGWTGKPASGAPADRARLAFWVRSVPSVAPMVPNGASDTTYTTPSITFGFEGEVTQRITNFGLRVVGTDLLAAATGYKADGNSETVVSSPLTVGAWYQLVQTAEFNDGQYNDQVRYEVYDATGARVFDTTLGSWEVPYWTGTFQAIWTNLLVQARRIQARNQLGNQWQNSDGGFFVDYVEITTWKSTDVQPGTAPLYHYATSFE